MTRVLIASIAGFAAGVIFGVVCGIFMGVYATREERKGDLRWG